MSQPSQRNDKATKSASAFRMTCAVSIDIQAAPERIWALLTDAADFPRWNSTVTREVFSGVMLPMIKGSLPDFAPSFEAYAADLKREAEAGR